MTFLRNNQPPRPLSAPPSAHLPDRCHLLHTSKMFLNLNLPSSQHIAESSMTPHNVEPADLQSQDISSHALSGSKERLTNSPSSDYYYLFDRLLTICLRQKSSLFLSHDILLTYQNTILKMICLSFPNCKMDLDYFFQCSVFCAGFSSPSPKPI